MGYNYKIMLKKLPMLGVLIVATVGFLPGQTAPPNAPKQGVAKPTSGKHGSDHSPAQDGAKATPNAPPIASQPPAPPCDEACQQGRQNLAIQEKLKQFTGILAKVGVVQTAILILTVFAIVGQTRANKNVARAWILVNHITNPVDRLKPTDAHPGHPGIAITFQVYGNTPAKITDYRFKIGIVPGKLMGGQPIPDLPNDPVYEERKPWMLPILEENVMLPPHRELPIVLFLKFSPDVKQLESLEKRESFLCAHGFIKYKDVFGRKGKTSLCYVYYFAQGGVMQIANGPILNPSEFRIGGPDSYNRTS